VRPEEFEVLFVKELVRQEFSKDRWIPIPEERSISYGDPLPS
jgi:tryptophan synthase beta chain